MAIQQAARTLARWQPAIHIREASPEIIATLVAINPSLANSIECATMVKSAFVTAGEWVDITSVTVDTPDVFFAAKT